MTRLVKTILFSDVAEMYGKVPTNMLQRSWYKEPYLMLFQVLLYIQLSRSSFRGVLQRGVGAHGDFRRFIAHSKTRFTCTSRYALRSHGINAVAACYLQACAVKPFQAATNGLIAYM